MQNQNTIEHFHWGHFGAILLCAAFLIGITFMRNGFQLFPQVETKQYTLADAERDVAIRNGSTVYPDNDSGYARAASDLAAINPTDQGAVLGAATGALGDIPDSESLLTSDKLAQIKLKTVNAYDQISLQNYSEQLSQLENNDGQLVIFANLNSTDKNTLNTSSQLIVKLVKDLGNMNVPKPMEEYHKVKMLYYTTLMSILQIRTGNISDQDLPTLSTALFSVLDRLNTLKSALSSQYNVELSL